ncbi:TetR/AcrR family transcriptional regulator [Spirillospora sp. CA-255316]
MSPRSADPAVRTELLEAAARVLADEGPQALTARRVASEVGTSTMVVYTRFGSMEELRRAIRQEGFARLAKALDDVPKTGDPVADLVAAGAAYLRNGLANPNLYRAMFLERSPEEDPGALGHGAFGRLVQAVRRCVDGGRFQQVDQLGSLGWAVQLWTMRHGMISLAITGLLPTEQLPLHYADMTLRLLIGYGDDPEAAKRSVDEGMRDYPQPLPPGLK